MKKLILVITLIIAVAYVNAQTPGFTIGPKIGATISKYNSDLESSKEEAINSIHWGAFARLGSKVYIQPELLFMKKSGVLINPDLAASEQTINLRTIDVPLLLGVKVADLKLTNIRVFAGPVASLTVNREIKVKNWDDAITKDDIRGANWAIQFGAGVDLLMFTADLRYELGMGDYSKIDTYSLKNNLVTLSLGWKIL
ncbi:MAG: porin family protein [Chloroflexota bacterium]|nr:porin family protein [Lentimicrobium sp.]